MNNEYAARYRDLYERHWWWAHGNCAILKLLQQHVPTTGNLRILDVGCGDGLLFDRLTQFGQVHGVELNGSLVSADNPWRERIYVGPFDQRFRPSSRFDIILMLDVLEHLPDPRAALEHAESLLEPDGLLVIHVPAFMALWTMHDELNHHYTRYSKSTLLDLLRQTHVKVATCRYTFHWTFPAKLVIRVKEKILRGEKTLPTVPNRVTNQLAYWLCLLEQRIFHRVQFGFGSSLLVVARNVVSCVPRTGSSHATKSAEYAHTPILTSLQQCDEWADADVTNRN